jgi:two-component system, LytTR family, sensor kinase
MHRFRNHILFWLLYVAFKTYLNISADSAAILAGAEHDWVLYRNLLCAQLSILTIKVPLVYICFYLLDGYLINHWSLIRTIAAFTLTFLVAVILMTLLNHQFILPVIFKYTGETAGLFAISSLLYHFFALAFVVGIACTIRLIRRQHRSSIREAELKKEKTESELKYLKGQINPHFLFNTLNNIYSLARKNDPQTSEAILKLSKLMRFMLYDASHQTILLADELKLITDYIELEKLRYSDRLKISYSQSIDNHQQLVAPLILIHFVENAFKHGASESRFDSYIEIDISLKEGALKARIANSKDAPLPSSETKPIGMENIKRQLELIYPNHQLSIQNNPDKFIVDLLIPLHK